MIVIPADWIKPIDIGLIIVYIVFLYLGAKKGFFLQIVSTAGTALSALISWRYCSVADDFFRLWPKDLTPVNGTFLADAFAGFMNEAVWFLLLFAVLRIIFLLIERLVSGLQDLPLVREISTLLGAALGAAAATVWVLVICYALNMPVFENGRQIVNETYLGFIRTTSAQVLREAGLQLDYAESINKLYTDFSSMDDRDQKLVREWLISHGYETIEEKEADHDSQS